MPESETVREALAKKGAYGPDVELDRYDEGSRESRSIDDMQSSDYKDYMEKVGVVADEMNRSGTLLFIDNAPSHCGTTAHQEGLEIMSLHQALEAHPGLRDYMWKAMDPTKDKFTAKSYLEDADGYFIRVKSGYHISTPVQTCIMLDTDRTVQELHNLVIVEDDASLEMITGCTTTHHANDALHVGVSEMYVGNNSSLMFSMIHNWSSKTAVRPRTATVVGRNSNYTNNYVIMNPVGTLQSLPVATLDENASAMFNTMCIAHEGSDIDTGGMINLNARGSNAQIMSRSISMGGHMTARGKLIGNAPGVKAHLECRSIIMQDGGSTNAVPELEAHVADVEMTHEAAVGKIAQDQIEYIMSRGLSEDEAVSMIVRGFLTGGINGLPPELQSELEDAIAKANLGD